MVKNITFITSSYINMTNDTIVKNRILSSYLSFMVLFYSGNNNNKQKAIEFFDNIVKSTINSKIPADLAVFNYSKSCLSELNI